MQFKSAISHNTMERQMFCSKNRINNQEKCKTITSSTDRGAREGEIALTMGNWSGVVSPGARSKLGVDVYALPLKGVGNCSFESRITNEKHSKFTYFALGDRRKLLVWRIDTMTTKLPNRAAANMKTSNNIQAPCNGCVLSVHLCWMFLVHSWLP